jgi:hypothetical protein
MWCFSITCIGICIYYFMIEKDIFQKLAKESANAIQGLQP